MVTLHLAAGSTQLRNLVQGWGGGSLGTAQRWTLRDYCLQRQRSRGRKGNGPSPGTKCARTSREALKPTPSIWIRMSADQSTTNRVEAQSSSPVSATTAPIEPWWQSAQSPDGNGQAVALMSGLNSPTAVYLDAGHQ